MDNQPRKRRYFSTARAGVLSLAAAVTWLAASPEPSVTAGDLQLRRERIAAVHAEASALEASSARAQLARANAAGLESRALEIERAVLLMASAAETVGRVSAVATRARLRIARLTPAPLRPRPPLFEWACTLAATGTFRDVQTFFELAEELAPVLRIDGFSVRRATNAGSGLLSLDVVFKAYTSGERALAVNHASALVARRGGSLPRVTQDPFAPIATATPDAPIAGLKGLNIADVTLHGVLTGNGQSAALLGAPDRRTYLARAGTELRDGRIKEIGRGFVTFVAREAADAEKEVSVGLSRVRR